ncbi:uncharacterized protein LOC117213968 isoform X1 [Bombus bifarius]|uniref:Uncharacterized protein LOC117213968 isoform X1 n=1 Tax=Bombus bifarius TaxID=103933 RepID=A0A6P8MPA8_9HYME|nr:uncharacterized protein LOC117213968 isoform X1 [Bombus bifarius]
MEDKQHEWWTHATAQQEVIITGSTASMKWETTNDWNTIVIPNDLYVTFSGLIFEETFSVNNTAARIRLRTVADSRRTPRSIENSVRSIPRAHTGIRACDRARAREHSFEGKEVIDGASLRRRVKRER